MEGGYCSEGQSPSIRTFLIAISDINPLALGDPYMGRTAQLTFRRCILDTFSTNIRTEYFKCAA
jgi:hypothetical protein